MHPHLASIGLGGIEIITAAVIRELWHKLQSDWGELKYEHQNGAAFSALASIGLGGIEIAMARAACR